MAKDMRSYLEQLERAGELTRITDQVDVDVDIGRRLFGSRDKALLFDKVKDYPGWKVLGQAPANMRHIGLALRTEPNKVVAEFVRRLDKGLVKCSMVDSGPVKQKILIGSDARPLALPAHVIGEKDPGRYIAGGLCIVKDPETGLRNMAFQDRKSKRLNSSHANLSYA